MATAFRCLFWEAQRRKSFFGNTRPFVQLRDLVSCADPAENEFDLTLKVTKRS